jgi:hypothetical protein
MSKDAKKMKVESHEDWVKAIDNDKMKTYKKTNVPPYPV